MYGGLEKELISYIDTIKHETDVFCFQESSEKIQKTFEKILPNYVNVYVNKNLDEDCNYYQSIYVNKKILVSETSVIFENEINFGLGIVATVRCNGNNLSIGNIHGIWTPKYNKSDTIDRLNQSKIIVDSFKKYEDMKIIGGDFNLTPETESIKIFEDAGYINLIKRFNIKTTRNEYAWKNYPNNKHLFADYVFVSPEVKVKNFSVPEMTISDHLPMILEIED